MAPAGSEALPGPRGGNPSLGKESQDPASPMAPSFWLLATAQGTPISSGRVGTQRGQTEAGGRRTERNEALQTPGSGSAGECPSSGNVRAEAFLALRSLRTLLCDSSSQPHPVLSLGLGSCPRGFPGRPQSIGGVRRPGWVLQGPGSCRSAQGRDCVPNPLGAAVPGRRVAGAGGEGQAAAGRAGNFF